MRNKIKHRLDSIYLIQICGFSKMHYPISYVFIYVYRCPTRIKWCSCRLPATRRISLVDQKLLDIQKQLSTPLVFLWGSCCSMFSFPFSVLSIIVCTPFLPLYCLSFFDLRPLITPLASSTFLFTNSYMHRNRVQITVHYSHMTHNKGRSPSNYRLYEF